MVLRFSGGQKDFDLSCKIPTPNSYKLFKVVQLPSCLGFLRNYATNDVLIIVRHIRYFNHMSGRLRLLSLEFCNIAIHVYEFK